MIQLMVALAEQNNFKVIGSKIYNIRHINLLEQVTNSKSMTY